MAITGLATATAAGFFLLSAAEVPNFLAGMMPSLMTIRRFNADQKDTATLRVGEALGTTLAVAVGVGASLIAHSWWPLVGTIAALAFLVASYEWAIRSPHPDAKPINWNWGQK
jgi:hypothetical protein